MISTPDGEPVAEPWRARALADAYGELTAHAHTATARPFIVAVDGRQGSGKSTLAARLAAHERGAAIVRSDDIAWWESFFGWHQLMAHGVLEPLRRGEDVDYRPPAWDTRKRHGSIIVPADAPLVVVEGVGVSRRSLAPYLDRSVWVQSDFDEANRRGIAREGGSQSATDFWWEWDREEQPFLATDRPWERADLVICGTPRLISVDLDPATEVLVGRSLRP